MAKVKNLETLTVVLDGFEIEDAVSVTIMFDRYLMICTEQEAYYCELERTEVNGIECYYYLDWHDSQDEVEFVAPKTRLMDEGVWKGYVSYWRDFYIENPELLPMLPVEEITLRA